MTAKEAIASLRTLCHTCEFFPKCAHEKPECFKAIELAISALQAQEAKTQLSVEGTTSDPISRQAAIDRINKQREHLQPDIYPQDKIGDAAYRICAEFIERLPSAQPEPQWIPVSERLPDDLGDYLVSIKRIGWNMEEYVENDIAYWDDLEGFHKADEVLAWIPLPEPYRAERRTDD